VKHPTLKHSKANEFGLDIFGGTLAESNFANKTTYKTLIQEKLFPKSLKSACAFWMDAGILLYVTISLCDYEYWFFYFCFTRKNVIAFYCIGIKTEVSESLVQISDSISQKLFSLFTQHMKMQIEHQSDVVPLKEYLRNNLLIDNYCWRHRRHVKKCLKTPAPIVHKVDCTPPPPAVVCVTPPKPACATMPTLVAKPKASLDEASKGSISGDEDDGDTLVETTVTTTTTTVEPEKKKKCHRRRRSTPQKQPSHVSYAPQCNPKPVDCAPKPKCPPKPKCSDETAIQNVSSASGSNGSIKVMQTSKPVPKTTTSVEDKKPAHRNADLIQYLSSTPDFVILASAINIATLGPAIADLETYTILAPSNAAFNAFLKKLGGNSINDLVRHFM
jgi:hypothetical protein